MREPCVAIAPKCSAAVTSLSHSIQRSTVATRPLAPPAGLPELPNEQAQAAGDYDRVGMLDRGLRHRVRLEPRGRPEMEIGDQLGLAPLEFRPQQLPEQVVVAVPLAAAVERDHQ